MCIAQEREKERKVEVSVWHLSKATLEMFGKTVYKISLTSKKETRK